MYLVKVEDFHLPIAMIVESGRPTCAAVVAAPMRKLWPLNRETSRPGEESKERSEATKVSLDRRLPNCRRDSGPGVAPDRPAEQRRGTRLCVFDPDGS